MIHLVKLEPMEERYTRQWEEMFPAACKDMNIPHNQINGVSIGDSVESGTVLDAHGTNYYKATQLQEIVMGMKTGEIGRGDVLFFYDLWYPGLEMVRYIADITGYRPMIAGFLHAGTWTHGDFNEEFLPWGRRCEQAWIDIADLIFVGSEYEKHSVAGLFPVETKDGEKIVVTGAPVDIIEVNKAKPELLHPATWDVIWPHRWDMAKRPDKLIEIAQTMPETFFLVTTSRPRLTNEPEAMKLYARANALSNVEFRIGITKAEYYQCLWESKVVLSTSTEESWGYGVAEGISAKCVPCVPQRASSPEHVHKLVSDPELAQEMIYPTDIRFIFNDAGDELDTRDIIESLKWCLRAAEDVGHNPAFNWMAYKAWVSRAHYRMLEQCQSEWARP